MIEPIFVVMAWHSRQTFPSNVRPKAFSQSVERQRYQDAA
jgi:hypothetical protein